MEEFCPKERSRRNHSQDSLKRDVSNISEAFRTTVIKILAGLERSIENTRETLPAEIKDLKTSQAEIKNAITKMKNRQYNHNED